VSFAVTPPPVPLCGPIDNIRRRSVNLFRYLETVLFFFDSFFFLPLYASLLLVHFLFAHVCFFSTYASHRRVPPPIFSFMCRAFPQAFVVSTFFSLLIAPRMWCRALFICRAFHLQEARRRGRFHNRALLFFFGLHLVFLRHAASIPFNSIIQNCLTYPAATLPSFHRFRRERSRS